VQLIANHREDTVGTDNDVALDVPAAFEYSSRALETDAAGTSLNRRGGQFFEQNLLESRAMNADVGRARPAGDFRKVDDAYVPPGDSLRDETLNDRASPADLVIEAQFVQRIHCVRPEGKTGAHFGDLGGALYHQAFHANTPKRYSGCEAADPCADDDDAHEASLAMGRRIASAPLPVAIIS